MNSKFKNLIELHLHIDGSVSPASARKLSQLSGIPVPEKDEDLKNALMCPPGCRSLNEYLSRFDLPCSLMQTQKCIESAVETLCLELKQLGLSYAELRFAPQKHCEKGLVQEDVIEAASSGIKNSHFNASLILCCMRGDKNRAQNIRTVELTKKYLGKNVCACDLAGAEALFPTQNFADVFALARKLEVPFTIHAGEACDPESVAAAVEMGASRIGHGISAARDEKVMELLAKKKIPVEWCPTSNLNTCVAPSVKEMPVPKLMCSGIIVTVNSDNMSVSNTNIIHELQVAKDAFGWDDKTIEQLLQNARDCAFVRG